MLNLSLAVCCSLAIGMIFKHTGRQHVDRVALLAVNYAAAVGVAAVGVAWGSRAAAGELTADAALIVLGVATGALLILGFFALSLATEVAGMSLAIGVMRISVLIPFLMSWGIWDEVSTVGQGMGLVLAGGAFFLIARRRRPASEPASERVTEPAAVTAAASTSDERASAPEPPESKGPPERKKPERKKPEINMRVFGVLALVFLAGGAVDVTMKTFEESFGAQNSRVLFLLMAFGIAFLIGLAVVGWRGVRHGRWPTSAAVGWGVVLGIINYGSLEFILRAIEQLPGTFVFPVNNIAIVLLAAVLGVTVWGETLTRLNRIGLGMAVIALLLLNL